MSLLIKDTVSFWLIISYKLCNKNSLESQDLFHVPLAVRMA